MLGAGVLAESASVALVGSLLLVAAALAAALGVLESLRRVAAGRRAG